MTATDVDKLAETRATLLRDLRAVISGLVMGSLAAVPMGLMTGIWLALELEAAATAGMLFAAAIVAWHRIWRPPVHAVVPPDPAEEERWALILARPDLQERMQDWRERQERKAAAEE